MINMSWKRKLTNLASNIVIKSTGLRNPRKMHSMFLESINPEKTVSTKYGNVLFSCPNELILWRIDTFHDKEPETLKWIEEMESNSTFFDIGANIGLYSIYAAKKGLNVFSFEPEALNYSELTKNVYLNKLSNIKPVNLALSSNEQFVTFTTSSQLAGTANQESDLTQRKNLITATTQTSFGTSVDKLIETYAFPFPNYIKIDVDGPELEIIRGMKKTIANKELRSVLIEIDENQQAHKEIIETLLSAGFKIVLKLDLDVKINNYIFRR